MGVPAVIDKDRLSALIAIKLNADALIISTAVDSVKTGFGTENEQSHRKLTLDECETLMAQGEFPDGSMGPKVGSLMELITQPITYSNTLSTWRCVEIS